MKKQLILFLSFTMLSSSVLPGENDTNLGGAVLGGVIVIGAVWYLYNRRNTPPIITNNPSQQTTTKAPDNLPILPLENIKNQSNDALKKELEDTTTQETQDKPHINAPIINASENDHKEEQPLPTPIPLNPVIIAPSLPDGKRNPAPQPTLSDLLSDTVKESLRKINFASWHNQDAATWQD